MVNAEYVAGLFDGEGYVGAETSGLRCTIANTDLNLLQIVQESFGGQIKWVPRSGKNIHWKDRYELMWFSQNAKNFLMKIEPYLIIKRMQAQLALDFPLNSGHYIITEEIRNKRFDIFIKLKAMKHEIIAVPEQYKKIAQLEHYEYLRKKQLAVSLRKEHPDWSIRQIASEMKVSGTMVHKYLKDSGVPTSRVVVQ